MTISGFYAEEIELLEHHTGTGVSPEHVASATGKLSMQLLKKSSMTATYPFPDNVFPEPTPVPGVQGAETVEECPFSKNERKGKETGMEDSAERFKLH